MSINAEAIHRRLSREALPPMIALLCMATLGCNDLSGLAGKQALPNGMSDPSTFNTPQGALALYADVVYEFQSANRDTTTVIGNGNGSTVATAVNYVLASGLLSDELQAGDLGGPASLHYLSANGLGMYAFVDARQLAEGGVWLTDQLYRELQGVRNTAGLAIGALAAYAPSLSPALRGHMYAVQGYSEIFLADLYCSGVPLSTLDYQGDYTLQKGSTTAQIYRAAIAKFDTALMLSSDSARILNLARVGKGRAWLALGQYDSAAAAVDSVPLGYSYQFLVDWAAGQPLSSRPGGIFEVPTAQTNGYTVSDSEGINGLPYRSSLDPRTASSTWGKNSFQVSQYVPDKYGGATPGVAPLTMADWIEARLIQAEAAYHGVTTGTGSWLDQLNALRQTAVDPALPTLSDPGTDSARVALLFRERAFWLFLTGHRQGDLRRLVRQYGLDADAAYPAGVYPLYDALSVYGGDVTAPVPQAEHANPLFTGCLSRGA